MRPLKEIIVHCSATRPDWMAGKSSADKVAEIRKWHVKDRGWKDIGYNAVIDRDGTVLNGRDLDKDGDSFDEVGAHTQGHNSGTVGICLIGGHGSNANDKFEAHFTPEQDAALRALIEKLQTQFPSITKVSGHNEYANKACPGFKVGEWLSGKPKSVAKSTTVQASAVQLFSGAGAGVAALGTLDGTAQIVALAFIGVVMLAAAWIMRERIKKWASGVQ